MISAHESLESGDGGRRCQVVRWERTFPFSFLSKREYVIGRRMFRGARRLPLRHHQGGARCQAFH